MELDTIIIGSGAGGLSSAICLSRAGQRVMVFEQHDVPGGWCHSFYLNGYRFTPGVHYMGLLEKGESMRPYNVGAGSTVTVGDIVDAVLKATGRNPKVVYDETKPTTIPFRMASTERIQKELGFKPKYTFEEGIKKAVEWYSEHHNG